MREKDDLDDGIVSEYAEAPDGGWGWTVVFASFMVHILIDGVTYSFGALATEFVAHFDASRESVGWMASVLVGMTFATGPLVSIMCKKFGFRLTTMIGSLLSAVGFVAPFFYSEFWFLYMSASLISGIGFSLVYLPAIVMVNIYFQKKRALAIGLAVCGSGIGTFVFSPLIEYLNEMYCWQGSMLLVGGLLLNCMACGTVYVPLPVVRRSQTLQNLQESLLNSEKVQDGEFFDIQILDKKNRASKVGNTQPQCSSQKSLQYLHSNTSNDTYTYSQYRYPKDYIKSCINDLFNKDLLCSPVFMIFAFSNFFNSIGFNAPFLYANDRALEMGVKSNYATLLISSIGFGNTLGRVIFGYLSTKSFVNRFQLYTISLTLSGLVVIFSSFALTYPWMVLYTMAFGLLTGTYVTLTSVVLVDLLGIDKLNESFGTLMVFQAVGIFIGPPLAGWIFDETNSFDCSFWVCGAFLTVSGSMLYLVYCFKEYRDKQKR